MIRSAALVLVFSAGSAGLAPAQTIEDPAAFFGFELGSDGEMARYPRVLEYFQHLAERSDRVLYEVLGNTTEGNDYALVTVSSPENLSRLGRLVEIKNRLADPRGLAESEAEALAEEGRPFYFLYATIHSTEVGNGQAVPLIAHRLATSDAPEIREILDGAVLLLVPSQNPDGQVKVIDHWYETKGTGRDRVYPDLYHKYVGHDDNRDWFMFTQVETRLNIERVQNVYRPTVTHDMHQQGPMGSRIFVPPFQDPYDRNVHPLLIEGMAQLGLSMASALIASGKAGVTYDAQYDLWTPARQYMVYHGQPRILTEIASANLADPFRSPNGGPLGPQDTRWNFPRAYTGTQWRLSQIVDYGVTAVFAGLTHLAKYRATWLRNFYRVHADWVGHSGSPAAFVVPRAQRDPYATFQLLGILDFGDVEIHRAASEFEAAGRRYDAGSWVVRLDQPYGAFAKTLLEIQHYPDLRYYEGGPPIPPYDVTGHTLGYLTGVDVEALETLPQVALERVETLEPERHAVPRSAGWAYVLPPETNAGFLAVNRLSASGIDVFRAAEGFELDGRPVAPGAFVVPSNGTARRVLEETSRETGLPVYAAERAPSVTGYRLKRPTRVGLYKAANSMPAGWLTWLFEKYEVSHRVMSSVDFQGDLADLYDVIVLPSGTSKRRMVEGLSPAEHDASWQWAYGIGEEGFEKLGRFVADGGTLVAIGSAVETATELLELPIEPVLPDAPRGFRRRGSPVTDDRPPVPAAEVERMFREAFQSPASLVAAIGSKVVDPTSLFYCPGSLLHQEFDVAHDVAFGMPARWPVFFRFDQAYRLKPTPDVAAEVVSRYPDTDEMVASGWLLGGELLRDQANVVSFRVGRGRAVTLGSQVDFRTQTPATFKLLFNAIVQGPAERLTARELDRLR